jgi:MtaA/CmuA family methyltransferase
MAQIDYMNWIGRRRQLRPVGAVLHRVAAELPFATLTRMAGRRMVAASAGAPAVLLTRANMEDALKDPTLLYEAMRFTVEEMELDFYCLIADLSLEAEACGCQLQFSDRDVPIVVSHPLQESGAPEDLRVPDPQRDGRMPVFLETMRLLKRESGMLKTAVVIGPFTLATHLRGTEVYLDTAMDPETVNLVLGYCTQVIIVYAEALIEAGADMILIAEPAGSQLSPVAYDQFSQAYSMRIIRALSRPCILHICGKAGHIVDKMLQAGPAAISIDDVDLPSVVRIAPKNIVVLGNVDTLTLANGSPEEIRTQTIEVLDFVKDRKEYIAAPGCDLAPNTPLENIQAFVQTVKGHRQ